VQIGGTKPGSLGGRSLDPPPPRRSDPLRLGWGDAEVEARGFYNLIGLSCIKFYEGGTFAENLILETKRMFQKIVSRKILLR